MQHNPEPLATSVLLIDGSKTQRTYWADQLKRCSAGYEIVEASDGQPGLDLYRSRPFDCVVLELSLPDRSGLRTLMALAPHGSHPQIAVVVLTLMTQPGVWDLAKDNGAHICLGKDFTTGEDLHNAIQRAVAFVGQRTKEERRHQNI